MDELSVSIINGCCDVHCVTFLFLFSLHHLLILTLRGGRTGQRGGAHGQGASSSEEEHFAQRHVQAPGSPVEPSATSHSESLNTTSPDNSAGSSSFVGLRVLAKWSSNSYFYSGSITRDLGENRFRLLFDDNQECEVQGKEILLCDPIPVETEVTALTEEEYFNIGKQDQKNFTRAITMHPEPFENQYKYVMI